MATSRKICACLCAAATLAVIFGTIYTVVQQAQRRAANDPQIQLAEDAAAGLNNGAVPSSLVNGRINMSTSLAPFLIIYDKQGRVAAGNGVLDSAVPVVPLGVLRAAAGHDYHAVTWQPAGGVRIAAVAVAAQNYFVLSGRSLKEVERNENATLQLSLFGGVLALIPVSLLIGLSLTARKHAA